MKRPKIRVAIKLREPSVAEAGYRIPTGGNREAEAYRAGLERRQAEVAAQIESLTGEPLDVVRRVTLMANVISANVDRSELDLIRSIPGVVSVRPERLYRPPPPPRGADK
ncbi:MAG: hypothetical protein E7426_04745 [Ruminococcaceae bacterium]|nr:hypothetical protein [Oscillospiraceae bacterium]